jgi:hypothetical protein
MDSKYCNSFDSCGYVLRGVSTAVAFLNPETFLPDLLDLPNEEERDQDEVSVPGVDPAAGAGDKVRRRRRRALTKGRAYGIRSGREKKAKNGQM